MVHVGTNSLYKDDTCTIAENILRIVDICKDYGVNTVFVSGLVYRERYKEKVREINSFLSAREYISEYTFIDNDNITTWDLWKDRLHLNERGTIKLANNFINAINNASAL